LVLGLLVSHLLKAWRKLGEKRALPAQQPPDQLSDSEYEARNTAWYSAMLQAWHDTRMERDKTIVTLSTGGIGFLVTFLTTVPTSARRAPLLYVIAILGFLAALVCSLWIFWANASYLREVMRGRNTSSKKLDRLDTIMLIGFGIGVLASILIGVAAATSKSAPGSRMEWI